MYFPKRKAIQTIQFRRTEPITYLEPTIDLIEEELNW